MSGHLNNAERVRDLVEGLYALLEPEAPSETEITAARWVSLAACTVAKDACADQDADMLDRLRAGGAP